MKKGQQVMVYRRDRDGNGNLGNWYWIASGFIAKIGTLFARVEGRTAEHICNEEFPIQSECCRLIPITAVH
jgi:hypothetical protein